MKRFLMICLVFLAILPVAQAASKKPKLNQTSIALVPGETFKLKVKNTKKKPKWTSSDNTVATVNKKGLVTAHNEGRTKITAKVGKKKLTCDVTIFTAAPPTEIAVLKKPLIYLYPAEETELTVRLGNPEVLTAAYPAYDDGWHVVAEPGGKITDLTTGRTLYSLYWEGSLSFDPSLEDEGFIVSGADTAPFLEEKLAFLGLTEREAKEFIIYWLPQMQENPYNLVRFVDLPEINEAMPLELSVEPDTLIRVWMVYKPLEAPMVIPEQQLPEPPARKGFTAVEWGGTCLP